MAQIPTPPASRPGSEAPEVKVKPVALEDSVQCLDTLLEKYLHLLDRQQKLQSSLAGHLSSGFFALAQANFSSPPGRRYGPDYYDGRMKATRKISIQSEQDTEKPTNDPQEKGDITVPPEPGYTFSIKSTTSDPLEEADGDNETKASSPVQSGHEKTSPAETASSEPSDTAETEITPVEKPEPAPKKFRSTDPIHWYGILVPQSLRRAQDSFANAIDNQVPNLASTTVEMRALEQQISELRARLEIESPDATML
ncbi:hypothetical protein DTO027I6_8237 [Penicillium roqueforti]|uniref:uncharacterized protein n=1 Tax=Penicillium roqueforti TaxID=5082 RepID=UPI00190C4794|nr:uncharacterized protein LCP9604111_6839 [Penicillium roqueforti]KAF9245521.1 hypothetical protein LCP9604111_6839 [Penicillium roqueforti]KAI1832923.1 hypothetical protein CBS147337_6334 [Penicillium roqueforti]KAI3132723.1 hypothetical protein CBS147330_3907 [Penicillium roqueforti]KAI3172219.1 hypothetical protein CBS147317_1648 [Penicillium roqueforti]KAI3192349.1 hypothetical protein DTO027I6_8237 [Penicillium roqueforti]